MDDQPSRAARAATEISHTSLEAALLSALGTDDRTERARVIGEASTEVDPDQLIDAVGDHADSRRRNAAIEALARGGARSVPALVRALRHQDPEVVMFSAGILARSGSASAIPHLVALLDHPDMNVAQQVIDSLSQLRSPLAVDGLLKMLPRDPWLRFAAVHALGEIGDRRAVSALVPLLDDPSVRDATVQALGKIGSAKAIDHLFRVLGETPDGESFAVCLRAIGQAVESERNEEALQQLVHWAQNGSASSATVEERLTRVLLLDAKDDVLGGNSEARRAAATIIKALRMQPLYTALVLAGRDPAMREVVEFSAAAIGEDIAPTLEVGLGANNPAVRVLSCECLGSMGHREVAASIEPLLADQEPQVRAAAVSALMRLGHEASIADIGKLLADPEPQVRQAAAAAFCRMDAEPVTEVLLAMADAGELGAASALRIMAANPHPAQRPFAVASLRDPSAAVRRAAAHGLAEQGGRDVAELLEPLLDDPDPAVRGAVVEALAPLPIDRIRRRLVAHARGDLQTRTATVCTLLSVGESTLLPLIAEIFPDEPLAGQLEIVRALARRPDPAAAAFLTRQLGHRDASMRRAVVLALADLLSATVLRALVSVARDEDDGVRAAVAEVLGPCTDPTARDTLNRLVLDPSQRVAVIARHWVERAAQDASSAEPR